MTTRASGYRTNAQLSTYSSSLRLQPLPLLNSTRVNLTARAQRTDAGTLRALTLGPLKSPGDFTQPSTRPNQRYGTHDQQRRRACCDWEPSERCTHRTSFAPSAPSAPSAPYSRKGLELCSPMLSPWAAPASSSAKRKSLFRGKMPAAWTPPTAADLAAGNRAALER
eukprot:7062904-Prymnesium_polylepis.1